MNLVEGWMTKDIVAGVQYLVDLFEAKEDVKAKLEPLQKLVEINLKCDKLRD
jgi:hypothetical protein